MKTWQIGDRIERRFEVTDERITQFGNASCDLNPLHFDEDFAKTTIFKGRIAHGMLTGAFISAAIADEFGAGTIYLEQNLKFLKPVRIPDQVRVLLVVNGFDGKVMTLYTGAHANGVEVIQGSAKILLTKS